MGDQKSGDQMGSGPNESQPNCPLIFDISHFFKSLVLIVAQFMIIQEELCIHIGFESKKEWAIQLKPHNLTH